MNIEPLESRIAPASIFNYVDLDGDKVKITSSVGTLEDGNVFLFPSGVGNFSKKAASLRRLDGTCGVVSYFDRDGRKVSSSIRRASPKCIASSRSMPTAAKTTKAQLTQSP